MYHPVIPVLAEPRVFAVLLPANAAVELVQCIHKKYAREMGKVRWRLPLTLGTVFFPRHVPLQLVLDAGWRLLARARRADTVKAKVTEAKRAGIALHGQLNHPSGDPWPTRVTVRARITGPDPAHHGRQVSFHWDVPTVMGDKDTFDIWYPWVRLTGSPTDRPLMFKHGSETWVHAMELKGNDEIEFYPSTWDFVFLEGAGERFTLAYDEEGRRLGLRRRPYYLEEVEQLVGLWEIIKKGLPSAQYHAMWQVLLERYARWALNKDGVAQPASAGDKAWQQFCRDTMLNAAWKREGFRIELMGDTKNGAPLAIDKLTGLAASGVLFDLFELYLTILKEGQEN